MDTTPQHALNLAEKLALLGFEQDPATGLWSDVNNPPLDGSAPIAGFIDWNTHEAWLQRPAARDDNSNNDGFVPAPLFVTSPNLSDEPMLRHPHPPVEDLMAALGDSVAAAKAARVRRTRETS